MSETEMFIRVAVAIIIALILTELIMPSRKRSGTSNPFRGWTDAQKSAWNNMTQEQRAVNNQFTCPGCGGTMIIPQKVRTFQCPHCGKRSRVNW